MFTFNILAANAYKEFMHTLSNVSKKRLSDSGLIRKGNIVRNSKRLLPDTPIERNSWFPGIAGYSPTSKEFTKMKQNPVYKRRRKEGIFGILKTQDNNIPENLQGMYPRNLTDSGKLTAEGKSRFKNIFKFERRLGGKAVYNPQLLPKKVPEFKHDALRHEKMEKLANMRGDVPKGSLMEGKGHVSHKVPVEDIKNYNQTGGNYFRNKETNIKNLRDISEPYISKEFEPFRNKRLRNRDYKRIAKRLDNSNA